MKKRFFVLALLVFAVSALLCISVSAAVYSGSCGPNGSDSVKWELDSATGAMRIYGSGYMYQPVGPDDQPWSSFMYGIKTVAAEEGVKDICDLAFSDCAGLVGVSLPSTLTRIGKEAFSGCTQLSEVTVPKNVAFIGEGAFDGCGALTDVYYGGAEPQWATIEIGDRNSYLTLAAKHFTTVVASGECGDGVTWDLFGTGVLTVSGTGEMDDFPDRSSMPWYSYIDSLKTVVIENGVLNIGDNAFRGLGKLSSVTFPESVADIGDAAFRECTALKKVTLPASVVSVGEEAFYGCEALTAVSLPSSVAHIGRAAFDGTGYSQNEENFENGVLYIGKHLLTADYTTCPGEYTVKAGTVTIADSAFAGFSSLTRLTLPYGVKNIGKEAFRHCEALSTVTLPASVASVGDGAFGECAALTDVYYGGTESEWAQIVIGENNGGLSGAEKHFRAPFTWDYAATATAVTVKTIPGGVTVFAAFTDVNGRPVGIKKLTANAPAAVPVGCTNIRFTALDADNVPAGAKLDFARPSGSGGIVDEGGGSWSPIF